MKKSASRIIAFSILILILFSSCSSLAVKAPRGMFVSTGDYVPEVRTLGIIQEKKTVFAPLFLIDVNKVHQDLYQKLIDEAEKAGADGVTNIRFSWKPSPFTYFSLFIFSGVIDFYIEGVAIKETTF